LGTRRESKTLELFEIAGVLPEAVSEGRTHTITFHHELGPRYNVVLANYFDEAIRNIVGVAPKIETGNNSFILSFTEPGA
ncbi:MAG: hypothetical protein M1587_05835, partial [Thaumarchaeota archaeon]|nr:hypothetical protein [Nitrososphaerota archaeon]